MQKEVDMGTTANIAPVDNAQEGETPPENGDAEQEYFSLNEEDFLWVTPGEEEFQPSQYNWDDVDDDTGSSFRVNALSTPVMGYCVRKSHVVTHDKQVITMTCGPDHKSQSHALARDTQDTTPTCGPNHKSSTDLCLQAGVTTGGKPPNH